MTYIDLNCDMGEGIGDDALLMPWISSANIACGYHAGDEETMKRTVELAVMHGVAIGAHPGFLDKENFGRTEMILPLTMIYDWIATQLHSLQKICSAFNTTIHHVKPHGALYNMAAKDAALADTIARAIKDVNTGWILYGLSGSYLVSEAKRKGLLTAAEVFADRTYQDDLSLTPRSQANALIQDEEQALQQVLQMIQQQTVQSITHTTIPIAAETICLHGDGKHAVAFAKRIHQSLKENNIAIHTI